RYDLVTGVQTCALPIGSSPGRGWTDVAELYKVAENESRLSRRAGRHGDTGFLRLRIRRLVSPDCHKAAGVLGGIAGTRASASWGSIGRGGLSTPAAR